MIYLLIPLFNESLNLEELHNSLEIALVEKNHYYLFVDDCSTDGTVNEIHKYFKENDYHVIEKLENKGPGDSFNLGFEWLLENALASDTVITLEGDNTSDLTTLPKMLTISDLGFDLVLASVYTQGGKLEKTAFFRKILSFFANLILRLVLNIKVQTLSSFYRVYKMSIIKKIKEKYPTIIEEKGFLSKVEILVKAIKTKSSIIEVPTTLLSSNRVGKSKMKIWKTLRDYLKLIFRMLWKKD